VDGLYRYRADGFGVPANAGARAEGAIAEDKSK